MRATRFAGEDVDVRDRLFAAVARVDAGSLASAIGGLFLVPENLHAANRLETLANVVLAGKAQGAGTVTRSKARTLVEELAGKWVGHLDDPWPNLATETFVYHGGTHTFLPGGENRVFVLRAIGAALLQSHQLPSYFRARALGVLQFACELSDHVLRAAGLGGNTAAPGSVAQLIIPAASRFEELRRAVTIRHAELAELAASAGVLSTDARMFIADARRDSTIVRALPDFREAPLLRTESGVVVLCPHRLADAAARNVVTLARELECDVVLGNTFHEEICAIVDRGLRGLGLNRVGRIDEVPTADSHVTQIFYQCDDAKVHCVFLATDALSASPTEPWNTASLVEGLKTAKTRCAKDFLEAVPPIVESAWMVVVASPARDYEITTEPDGIRTLVISAGDLDVIVHAERADPLVLWKYQLELEEMHSQDAIEYYSQLDAYAVWKASGRNLARLANGARILATPGTGESLRREVAKRRDWQALPSWLPGSIVEVGLEGSPEHRTYVPRHGSFKNVKRAVKTGGPVVWVVPQDRAKQSGDVPAVTESELARTVAFWISEFALELGSHLASAVSVVPIVVEVGLVDREALPAVGYDLSTIERHVTVRCSSRFTDAYDDTNEAERRFAERVVSATLASAGVPDAAQVVARVVGKVAPLGVKRMLHAVHPFRNPVFVRAEELPHARLVQDFDQHRARRIVSKMDGYIGAHDGHEAGAWLKRGVAHLYQQLRADLATHDARQVLPILLLRYEALVFEDALRDLTVASVLACTARDPENRERLDSDVALHSKSANATRFIIEHVVAEPPSGTRALDVTTFDSWLSRASELVALGYASDVAFYGLANVRIDARASDYDVDLGGYDNAITGRGKAHSEERLEDEDARTRVPRAFVVSSEKHPSMPSELEGLNLGVLAEFGVTLEELKVFFEEAVRIALDGVSPYVSMLAENWVAMAAESLGWSNEKVRTCLGHFSLSPREEFLCAPLIDVLPWKFNRGMSYVRRPFLRTNSGGLFYTPGHVDVAVRNLFVLLTTARYKARTSTLASAMSLFAQHAPAGLVVAVGNVCEQRGLVVRKNVKKIGRVRIESARGRSLGDVDVLVANLQERRITAIECKDIQLDRVPHEIANDVQALFISKNCAQDRHLARVEWLQQNLASVLEWLEVDADAGGWQVAGALVFSRPLASMHLGVAKLPVWTFRDVRQGRASF